MVVYWEYAFAENFLLDALLLYLALSCARVKSGLVRLPLAAAVGAAEAVLFPLFDLPVWAAYLVKFTGGAALPLIAAKKGGAKGTVFSVLFFFLGTFALGGLLTAAYSFFGVEYAEGNGFLVERAPVALVVALAGIFCCLCARAARAAYRYRRTRRNLFDCTVTANGRKVKWRGFADSGNLLLFRGEPVCVISPVAALALFKGRGAVGRMEISTVNSVRESPVFVCEEMEIGVPEGKKRCGRVYFTVGDVNTKDYQMILNTSLLEGRDEDPHCAQGVAAKDKGERKRRALSLRERGAAPAALCGGGGGGAPQTRGGGGDGDGEGPPHRA